MDNCLTPDVSCHDLRPLVTEKYPGKNIAEIWKGSALHKESTLHQIAPYIGKIKSSMACALISMFSHRGEILYDPFCGSGTVPLEAWIAGRNVIANDMSPYAVMLTQAKLFPNFSVQVAIDEIHNAATQVHELVPTVDLQMVPEWVQNFFHPATLREAMAWTQVLGSRKAYFLLSCLLGILHHQRPGFLSYPSSHTVPYLRSKKFPRDIYPKLYQYRPVQERLEKKVMRTLRRVPQLDNRLIHECHMQNAAKFIPNQSIDVIITSPPYMRQLDYGRDNRLRLWLLGLQDWKSLDHTISPSEAQFIDLLKSCLHLWHDILAPKGLCIFVLGDVHCRRYNLPLADALIHIATEEVGGYTLTWRYAESIPNTRRVRRGYAGILTETILVLKKE